MGSYLLLDTHKHDLCTQDTLMIVKAKSRIHDVKAGTTVKRYVRVSRICQACKKEGDEATPAERCSEVPSSRFEES